jgi:hypothetical protein
MRRLAIFVSALSVALCLSATRTRAQHGPGGAHGGFGHGPAGMAGGEHAHGSAHEHSARMEGRKTPDQLLAQNSKLSSKLQDLLPAGTNLQEAAAGFKNLGQFVAAVHVSHNLGIPFDQLKARMTGPHAESLGKAIHALKPDADVKSEVGKAKREADSDLKEAGS